MDTLSRRKTFSENDALTKWEACLAAESPAAFLYAITHEQPPALIGLMPFPVKLARKVATAQWWSAKSWSSPHQEGWRKAWQQQENVDHALWPEILQDVLMSMGPAECRFKPGEMHFAHWRSYIEEMIQQGMDINAHLPFSFSPCTALDFLLESATTHPYHEIAVDWIEHLSAACSTMNAERASFMLDRISDIETDNAKTIIEHILARLDSYDHDSQSILLDWIVQYKESERRDILIAHINNLFLDKQTRAISGMGTFRRL